MSSPLHSRAEHAAFWRKNLHAFVRSTLHTADHAQPLQERNRSKLIQTLGKEGRAPLIGPAIARIASPTALTKRKSRNREVIVPMQPATESIRDAQTDGKGVTILARSLFRQMRQQGYSPEQIINLSSELIELVREDLCKEVAAQ